MQVIRSKEERLDIGLEDSMDASDPPAVTQPVAKEPLPSSGFPEPVCELSIWSRIKTWLLNLGE